MKKTMRISGIDCGNCALKLETAIKKVPGVNDFSLNFLTGRVVADLSDDTAEETMAAIQKLIGRMEPSAKLRVS